MTAMKEPRFIDIHVLETTPPSNMNRDENGSPKTARYGNTLRHRVSSQSWKKATTRKFHELCPEEAKECRTREQNQWLAELIAVKDPDVAEMALKMADAVLKKIKFNSDDTNKKAALVFVSEAQMDALAQLCIENKDLVQKSWMTDKEKEEKEKTTKKGTGKGKKSAQEKEEDQASNQLIKEMNQALMDNPTLVQLLFGRMFASNPEYNYEAACQVAHALSTHPVQVESDYFSAVDDRNPHGAGHIDEREFVSSTLYRYANVNVSQLLEQGRENLPFLLSKFVEAFVTSIPTGMQNSYGNTIVPTGLVITVRSDQPVSFVGAFESAVSSNDGYEEPSKKALANYVLNEKDGLYNTFVEAPEKTIVVGKGLEDFGTPVNLKQALAELKNYLHSSLSKETEWQS